MSQTSGRALVALFGYDSSLYTQKVQHILRLKQIPYTFVTVPSMMPRPVLKDNFNISYRKIPALALDRDIYLDTSIICEALEQRFPASDGYQTMYPPNSSGGTNRSVIRGMASYWTDRPVFRATCGLMPTAVWRSKFGQDRAQLIGHKLDPDKLQKKMPEKLSEVDMQCSMLEAMLEDTAPGSTWIFDTKTPSMADVAWYVQLDWGWKNSQGAYIDNLTAGDASSNESDLRMDPVFNEDRYPRVLQWFNDVKQYLEQQPSTQTRVEDSDTAKISELLKQITNIPATADVPLLRTPAPPFTDLDAKSGLVKGATVAIAPDDTGRGDPTTGRLLATSPEEIVIAPEPMDGKAPSVGDIRLHFPRLGFVTRVVTKGTGAKL